MCRCDKYIQHIQQCIQMYKKRHCTSHSFEEYCCNPLSAVTTITTSQWRSTTCFVNTWWLTGVVLLIEQHVHYIRAKATRKLTQWVFSKPLHGSLLSLVLDLLVYHKCDTVLTPHVKQAWLVNSTRHNMHKGFTWSVFDVTLAVTVNRLLSTNAGSVPFHHTCESTVHRVSQATGMGLTHNTVRKDCQGPKE